MTVLRVSDMVVRQEAEIMQLRQEVEEHRAAATRFADALRQLGWQDGGTVPGDTFMMVWVKMDVIRDARNYMCGFSNE